MAEYIDREYAVDAVVDVYYDTPDINLSCEKFEAAIIKIPAADVAPVRHGRWIDAREYCGDYMCSNCEALYGTNKFNYCPNCGAKMDGELNE